MKRINITPLGRMQSYPGLRYSFAEYWRADSTRFAISAYGRTVAEARQRLFVTVNVEKSNRREAEEIDCFTF